jgi:hypothetical protein
MDGDVGAGPDGGVACVNDDECKLVSDYCDGCNCLVLGPGESAPICKGTLVQCLLDPCSLKLPKCLHGQCIAAARTQSS